MSPGRLRIGFSSCGPAGTLAHAECVAAVLETAALCEALGHEVTEDRPRFDAEHLQEAFYLLWCDGTAWMIDTWAHRTGRVPTKDLFTPATWGFQSIARQRTSADHLLAVEELQRGARDFARFFEDHDMWLTPTMGQLPPVLSDEVEDDPWLFLQRDSELFPFTIWANATGQPAMSVPLSWSEENLPVGSQFVGRFGGEATLVRLASQLEEAKPWRARFPPLGNIVTPRDPPAHRPIGAGPVVEDPR